jgi:hypothetical protein
MPPHLANMSLKQMWSGQMNNARVVEELTRARPGLIVTKNDGLERPYQQLLSREYKLVYRDRDNRLYAHSSISRKPVF